MVVISLALNALSTHAVTDLARETDMGTPSEIR